MILFGNPHSPFQSHIEWFVGVIEKLSQLSQQRRSGLLVDFLVDSHSVEVFSHEIVELQAEGCLIGLDPSFLRAVAIPSLNLQRRRILDKQIQPQLILVGHIEQIAIARKAELLIDVIWKLSILVGSISHAFVVISHLFEHFSNVVEFLMSYLIEVCLYLIGISTKRIEVDDILLGD